MGGFKVGGVLLAVVALVASCSGGDSDTVATKAGGSAPVTLRIGTDDLRGRPAADAIEEFAREVDERSDGRMRVEPVWHAAGPDPNDWDQAVARMVVDGDLDMGMIPARAWDTEGVTTLRALHAPFLVTSDGLVNEIVTGDLADEMLAGLDEIGITGLALLPEGLRHVFAFGDALLAPADYADATVRAPTSTTTFALFEALGAKPDDYNETFNAEVRFGAIAAAESSFALAGDLPAATTATGNVTLFPKVNSIVVNTEAFNDLSDEQRETLRDAAADTRGWAVNGTTGEDDLAATFCEQHGGRVVHATEAQIAALDQAAQPVYGELRQDEATAELIDRIRQLKDRSPEPVPVRPCEPRAAQAPAGDEADTGEESTFQEGIARTEMSAEALRDRGVPPVVAADYDGIVTLTAEDGRWSVTIDGQEDLSCAGTYTVESGRITYVMTPTCAGVRNGAVIFSAAFEVEDGRLLLSDFRDADGKPAPNDEAIWGGDWDWKKLD